MLVFKFSNNLNKDKNGKMLDGNGMGDDMLLGFGNGGGGHNYHSPAADDAFAYCKQNTESSRGVPDEEPPIQNFYGSSAQLQSKQGS
jgi:hypothetical protein